MYLVEWQWVYVGIINYYGVGRICKWNQSKEKGIFWVCLRDSLPWIRVLRGEINEIESAGEDFTLRFQLNILVCMALTSKKIIDCLGCFFKIQIQRSQTCWIRIFRDGTQESVFFRKSPGDSLTRYCGDQWCREYAIQRSWQHDNACVFLSVKEESEQGRHPEDCCYGPFLPKVWSLNQQLGWPRACWKYRTSGPTPHLLNHNLHFNNIPRGSHEH